MAEHKSYDEIMFAQEDAAPSVSVQVANLNEYTFAKQQGKGGDFEQAERVFVQAAHSVAILYDAQVPALLGNAEKRINEAARFLDEFESAVGHLNPKGTQLAERSGVGEIMAPKEPVAYGWRYGRWEDYQIARQRHGYAGFLALGMVERGALQTLHKQWMRLSEERVKTVGNMNIWDAQVNKSPYLRAQDNLKRRLIKLEVEEFGVIMGQPRDSFEFGDPKTPRAAREKAIEKLAGDLSISIVMEQYFAGVMRPFISREIVTHTVDPDTKIRFITHQGFMHQGTQEAFEPHGTIGISGFGPNGEIYYLTPEYRSPQYSTRSGDTPLDTFQPFYRDKNSYGGVAPRLSDDKQIKLWRAYCRATSNVAETEDAFRDAAERRRDLSSIYWGAQMEEVRQFSLLKERLKRAKLLQEAQTSDFGKIRFGIQMQEISVAQTGHEVAAVATPEQLQEIQRLFDNYWNHPEASQLVYNADEYRAFSYPYGWGGGSYPDDYGKVINIRLSQNERTRGISEILIRDAYDEDTGTGATGYLRVTWNEHGVWAIERGRYTSTPDAYFLDPREKKVSVGKADAETVLLAFRLLEQPKQKRHW